MTKSKAVVEAEQIFRSPQQLMAISEKALVESDIHVGLQVKADLIDAQQRDRMLQLIAGVRVSQRKIARAAEIKNALTFHYWLNGKRSSITAAEIRSAFRVIIRYLNGYIKL